MIVYCITNKINGKKYIGSDSKNNPKYYGSGIYIKKAIKKYGKINFTKQILCSADNIELMKELEEYWIEYFDAYNNSLFYNATKHAAGISKFPENKKINIINANKGNKYHQGYIQSEYQKQQTSIANSGKKHSIEFKEKKRQRAIGNKYALGNKFSQESLKKLSIGKSKSIIQYDLEMNFIKEWNSIRQAGKTLCLDEGQISNCCNNKIKKVKIYIFKFK